MLWFPPGLLGVTRVPREAVSVRSSCCNKIPQTGWLFNNRHLFLSSGGWKTRTEVPADPVGPLPVHDGTFSLRPHMAQGQGVSLDLFCEGSSPMAPPADTPEGAHPGHSRGPWDIQKIMIGGGCL